MKKKVWGRWLLVAALAVGLQIPPTPLDKGGNVAWGQTVVVHSFNDPVMEGQNEIHLDNGGDLSGAITAASGARVHIILHPGVYTGLDKVLPTSDSLYISSATPWMYDAVWVTGTDSLIRYNSDKVWVEGITFSGTGAGSLLWLGTRNAHFRNCRFTAPALNMGTGMIVADNCQVDITTSTGWVSAGNHVYNSTYAGYEYAIVAGTFHGINVTGGTTVMNNCKIWSDSAVATVSGTANFKPQYGNYYSKGGDSCVVLTGQAGMQALQCVIGTNASAVYCVDVMDSAAANYRFVMLDSRGATMYGFHHRSQANHFMYNTTVHGSGLADTSSNAGDTDGFTYLNDPTLISGGLTNEFDLVKLEMYNRTFDANAYFTGSLYMPYFVQFPDTAKANTKLMASAILDTGVVKTVKEGIGWFSNTWGGFGVPGLYLDEMAQATANIPVAGGWFSFFDDSLRMCTTDGGGNIRNILWVVRP